MPGEEKNTNVNAEEVVKTTVVDDVAEPHPASGMYQYMQEFMGDDDEVVEDKGESADDKTDDTDVKDDDKTSIEIDRLKDNEKFAEVISKDSLSEKDLEEFELSEEELTSIREKLSGKFEKKEDFGVKLEEMETPMLVEEVKKNQRLVSERETKIKELEEKINGLSKSTSSNVNDEKLKLFFEDIKKDINGGWKKHAKELGLPDLNLIQASNSNGSIEDRLLQWQESELKAKIEEEFGLEKGEFEVVREDLYQPKTPSYRWRTATEAKEQELKGEVKDQMRIEAERLNTIQKQQAEDLKWFADAFLEGKLEEAEKVVEDLNAIPEKIAKGELTPEKHPFALRNLMLGLKHQELVDNAVKEAVAEITKQFNDKGVYLKAEDLPTDVTQVKPAKSSNNSIKLDKETLNHSPMLRGVNDLLNNS